MSESLLQLAGAPPNKQPKHASLTTSSFFSGLFTQRSPFGTPDGRYYARVLGGRTDILIDGLNVELTNYGTVIRRPGNVSFSSASLGSAPLTFYSFHPPSSALNPITLIADTASNVYTLDASSKTSILTKGNGAGQSYFQGIGSNLYIGDGVDLQVWPGTGTTTRNWGIAMNNTADTTGPNGCGTGTDVPVTSGTPWNNPGNITANDGSFATVTLPAPTSGQTTVGPNAPGTAATVGSGRVWSSPNNALVSDGIFTTSTGDVAGDPSQELTLTNYTFSIPANATINGILVEVQRETGGGLVIDNDVTLLKANVAVGSNKGSGTPWPIAEAYASYGGSADLWGTTWTSSDINDSGFGVQVSCIADPGITAKVDFVRISVTYTIPVGDTTLTDLLEATNFGFGLSLANTISGVLVEVKGLGNSQPTGTSISVQMLKNGSQAGTAKTGVLLPGSNSFTSLGGSSDLWGTTFSPGDMNNSSFGISIQGVNSGSASGQWSIDFVRITVYGTGGPNVVVSGSAGSFSATAGYKYIYAYGNSNSGHVSNPTPPSASTGIFTNKLNVSVDVTASTDPQVNQIRVFRTKDGGSIYFELPSSPYSNTTTTITDSASDASLSTLSFFDTSPWLANSTPPAGLIKMTYHLSRMWGVVGNIVYFSALLGDDITLGVGIESWPPVNVFVFPTQVNRLLPIASGLLVFTTDDVYMIIGSTRASLFAQLFQQGVGLLSYNALDVEGNLIFLYTSDKQFIAFSAAGPAEIGYPIGVDLQTNIDPSTAYVAALVSGTQDKAVFISDASTGWYRCNWNQPPEGGPAWSPKANIIGGVSAVVSVETSPGIRQLISGQSNGTVLARSYSTFTDNGNTYSGYATVGSLVLAKPGQLAGLNSIVLELQKVGSVPSVSIMLDEISGNNFETLISSVDDPPRLAPSTTLYSKRWYLAQGQKSAYCRNCQVMVSFASENAKNELLTMTLIGSLINEE